MKSPVSGQLQGLCLCMLVKSCKIVLYCHRCSNAAQNKLIAACVADAESSPIRSNAVQSASDILHNSPLQPSTSSASPHSSPQRASPGAPSAPPASPAGQSHVTRSASQTTPLRPQGLSGISPAALRGQEGLLQRYRVLQARPPQARGPGMRWQMLPAVGLAMQRELSLLKTA